jgi:hypothetical protein
LNYYKIASVGFDRTTLIYTRPDCASFALHNAMRNDINRGHDAVVFTIALTFSSAKSGAALI